MPDSLLTTKISLPILRRTFVPRKRALGLMHKGFQDGHLLTLVSAPAGYGKTTTIRMWAEEADCPVAWVILEKSDNDLRQFLAYLLTALNRAADHLGQEVLEVVESAQEVNSQQALGLLVNDLHGLDRPIILVLEEYHLIENEQIDRFIEALLVQNLPSLHLVIATREDPGLPLTRLRVRNQLTEIRAADLSFSLDEASDFFSTVMGVTLSKKQVETLRGRTEGWAAGLQLAALSLKENEDPARFVEGFRGTHRHVLDYLIEEVLASQPEEVRVFLRRTSILDQLCASLCEAVTGQPASRKYLHDLESNNLFLVALDEERTWYRYHALFGELLRNQLLLAEPEGVDELHERAANWYQAHGFIQKAVEHAFQSSRGDQVSRLIERHAMPALYQGEVATVVGWFDRLPEPLLHASPLMCVSRAWSLALLQRQTRMDELAQTLQAAEAALKRPDVEPGLRELVIGHIASIQAYLMQTPALADEAPEKVIETSQRAQRLLPAGERAIRSVNALNIGYGYAALADLPAAEQAFRQAFDEGMAGGNYYAAIYGPINLAGLALAKGQPGEALQSCETNIARFNRLLAGQRFPPIGALHILKGNILLGENRLAEAEQELTQGLSLIRHTGEYEAYVEGHSALARLRCIQGDRMGMAESLGMLAETRPEIAFYAQALRHRLSAYDWATDRLSQEEARRWLAQSPLRFDALPAVASVDPLRRFYFQAYLCAAHVRARLAACHPQAEPLRDVHAYLARQETFAEAQGLTGWLVQVWTARAVLYRVEGQAADARRLIRAALAAAAPRGYVRIFLDDGDLLRPLLEAPELRTRDDALSAFVQRLLEAMPGAPARSAIVQADAEQLSDRELDVLRLLAAEQSYKEIGQQLFLSLNTVQFHVKNIYGKLAVNKRVQAIEKARALELI
jgi:LuxR family transcriptional regulator, maltose regulon positive regulatory protein